MKILKENIKMALKVKLAKRRRRRMGKMWIMGFVVFNCKYFTINPNVLVKLLES